MNSDTPVLKDIVLIGGGHAHVSVLRSFGMKPIPGVRITLLTRDIHTPYSSMLPGFVAGHYTFDEAHIDLGPLAQFASARIYHGEVKKLNLQDKEVQVSGRPPIKYDYLSINTGSTPKLLNLPGNTDITFPIKPIDKWLENWEKVKKQYLQTLGKFHVVIVGGGAGGIELALATYHWFKKATEDQNGERSFQFDLVTDSHEILPTHNKAVRRSFHRFLGQKDIRVWTKSKVIGVDEGSVKTENGKELKADAIFWVTTAGAPSWPKDSGLAVDSGGFIEVDQKLRSTSHADVFAAGDVASLPTPRPKSGVFAVRQGSVLAKNLRRLVKGKNLKSYRAQKNFLGLISNGDRYAVASRGNWSLEGKFLWSLKNFIDRRFIDKFNQLPEMNQEEKSKVSKIADKEAIKELSSLAMRCGGCGAKVGSTVLSKVINKLPDQYRDDVLIGLNSPDDAAAFEVPKGKIMVQSVDYFRAFIDDPYIFGRIAANHALGDIFAMGAEAQSALAIATVPYGRESIVEQTLSDLMQGALDTLKPTKAILAGGHSSEGSELAFGLTVNGLIGKDQLLRKGGMRPGDVLILTKPIGTGTLFAAQMRGKAKGRWVDGAIQAMLISNQQAAQCLYKYGASACTDVTGFGLLGHLVEMTKASEVDVEVNINQIPILDGAEITVSEGIFSSLQPQNIRLRRAILNSEKAISHNRYPLLFDPQTAGGLLASIPSDMAAACIEELKLLGYGKVATIGRVSDKSDNEAPISINLS
tara:strand:- start:14160 stop:16418 length:2259 start_codon:yes stop_codon:yes gene_type:complete